MRIDRRAFFALTSAGAAGAVSRLKAGAGYSSLSSDWLLQTPAQQPPPATPKFDDVRRGVGIFTMRGGTIGWLINKDAAIAIDTQYADTAKTCVDGLKQKSGG